MQGDEESIDPWQSRLPPGDVSPDELEQWVVDALSEVGSSEGIDALDVRLQDKIEAGDGTYAIDATVRFRSLGFDFLVLVEVKRHRNPIKRELVQVLHSKVTSIGAHKGVMFSTAHFQRGAIEYAKAHGIALVFVTEGRLVIEYRSADPVQAMSRERAAESGVPRVIGVYFGPGDLPDSTRCVHVGADRPDLITEFVLGVQ